MFFARPKAVQGRDRETLQTGTSSSLLLPTASRALSTSWILSPPWGWLPSPHFRGCFPGYSCRKNLLPCLESCHLPFLSLLFAYIVKYPLYFKLLFVFIYPFAITIVPFSGVYLEGRFLEGRKLVFLQLPKHADGDCSHEIKRCLLLGREVMTNLDSILKSRDITLPTKVHLVKAMVSPVVMYGCESWTVKKAECWRMDAFELWCWRRLLRVP